MKKLAVCLLLIGALAAACAQGPPSGTLPQNGPRITKLPPPSYPPMALAAHVWGHVVLSLTVQQDGTVSSAEIISGPAMLREAAVESAEQTRFNCPNCASGATQFQLVESYELTDPYFCEPPDKSYPRVSQSAGIITITGQPAGTCDPEGTVEKVRARSAKCLYMWKCGWR
jgi:TonB family protein